MKNLSFKTLLVILRICIGVFVACLVSLFLLSFTLDKIPGDFFNLLGISKSEADKKIINSVMGGSINQYGVRNAKNIALGNREAVVKDLLSYTRQQVNGSGFINAYTAMKNSEKPAKSSIQTPAEMRAEQIAMYKKAIADNETAIKNVDASLKPVFQNALADAKKGLAGAEDPNNKEQLSYQKNYPDLLKMTEDSYQQQLGQWEAKYPANHLLFVKKRLEQFLKETNNIDFDAELTERNGKKYFVNKSYESKGYNWKLAFRASKEVILPARAFVQQWLEEIK